MQISEILKNIDKIRNMHISSSNNFTSEKYQKWYFTSEKYQLLDDFRFFP